MLYSNGTQLHTADIHIADTQKERDRQTDGWTIPQWPI